MTALLAPLQTFASASVSHAEYGARGCTQRVPATRLPTAGRLNVRCKAEPAQKDRPAAKQTQDRGLMGLGDLLGPIGLTIGGALRRQGSSNDAESRRPEGSASSSGSRAEADVGAAEGGSPPMGVELGPVAMTFGRSAAASEVESEGEGAPSTSGARSIHDMSTEEWRVLHEPDGCVDLWVQEEFNAGSRLVGGRAVHKGGAAGAGSGEGRSASNAPRHRVKIFNHHAAQEVEVDVPEDRYVLWEAEDQGLLLPYACRMGCCTACAVRVLEGDMYQPQSLGVSAELKQAGYALMCVGYPRSDLVLETVPEDEVYNLQFGRAFAERAVDPSDPDAIERDDFALEIANMDE